jgi:hypothetical protein
MFLLCGIWRSLGSSQTFRAYLHGVKSQKTVSWLLIAYRFCVFCVLWQKVVTIAISCTCVPRWKPTILDYIWHWWSASTWWISFWSEWSTVISLEHSNWNSNFAIRRFWKNFQSTQTGSEVQSRVLFKRVAGTLCLGREWLVKNLASPLHIQLSLRSHGGVLLVPHAFMAVYWIKHKEEFNLSFLKTLFFIKCLKLYSVFHKSLRDFGGL